MPAAGAQIKAMSNVIVLLRCDLCGTPVSKKKVRRMQFLEVPLCDRCFLKVRKGPGPQGKRL